jgi:Homeodomain-like domain
MATTHPTQHMPAAERRALALRLAADAPERSARSIAQQVGAHHTTVARWLRTTERTTPAPEHAPERTTPPTSANTAPTLDVMGFDPQVVRDLVILVDLKTGHLPAPLERAIHQWAEHRRSMWRALDRADARG